MHWLNWLSHDRCCTLRRLHRHALWRSCHHDRLLAHLIGWQHYRLTLRHLLHHYWLLCHSWLHHWLLHHGLHTRLLLIHNLLLWLHWHHLLRLLLVHHLLLRLLHHHRLLLLIHWLGLGLGLSLISSNLNTTWMLHHSIWIDWFLSLWCTLNRWLVHENL